MPLSYIPTAECVRCVIVHTEVNKIVFGSIVTYKQEDVCTCTKGNS